MGGVDASAAGIMRVWRRCGNQFDKTGRKGVIEGMGRCVDVLNHNLRVGIVF